MAAPAYQAGTTQDSAGAQSLTFTIPGGASSGDFMLVMVKQSENTAQQIWDDDGGGGNGWTRLDYHRTTGGRDQETAVYYKFHSGSESNPTFTWNSGGTNEPMSGIMLVYDNVDTINPIADFAWHWAQNDCNPPNPDVNIEFENTRVVCFHAATHDDISSVGAPTGFTIRDYVYGGSAGHTADHRDCFSADIEVDTIGNYSPPDWTHGASNTTPEYQCYTIALNELQPIHLTAPSDNTNWAWKGTNQTVSGDGFESSQGTGKVELWSDTSGTTKVSQSVDSWSDTSIQIDVVQSTLVDGVNYLVVTNNSGDVSRKVPLIMGFAPYNPVTATDADLYWTMNNTYADTGARGESNSFDAVQRGSYSFSATPICRSTTHSFYIEDSSGGSEPANSDYTNMTNTHTYRNIGGWVRIEAYQNTPAVIYEEGGGVNNIYMLMMPNGKLAINVADSNGSPDFKHQAYSDFSLITGRPYHVMIDAEFGDHFDLYIDGVKQTTEHGGTLGADTSMSTHSGGWSFGDPDGNLDTGGVDIAYDACNPMYLAHWGTWSGVGGGAPLSATTDIRDSLFRDGALEEHSISSGTESAMQTDMEAYDSQTHADYPLTYHIPQCTGGDFELTLTDQVWPDECKFHLRYIGGDTLTIRNSGTSNFDVTKSHTPLGGTIEVIETAGITITVKDISDNSVIDGARVLLEADTGGPLTAGEDIISGVTNASGIITGEIDYTSNQPVVGRVRSASGTTKYQQSDIVATVTSSGLNLTVFMVGDE